MRMKMRTVVMCMTPAVVLAAMCLVLAQDKTPAKPAPKPAEKGGAKTPAAKPPVPAGKEAPAAARTPASKTPAAQPAKPGAPAKTSGPNAEHEQAIRKAATAYAAAYSQGDAKAVAAYFSADAEYVDASGAVLQGRPAIEQALTKSIADAPGSKLAVDVQSVRFLGSGLAIEDGIARMTPAKGTPVDSRYTAVHSRVDGKWLIVSVRDQDLESDLPASEHLKAFDWMLGDWVDEGDDSVIEFSCKPAENGNFLLRDFTIKIAGKQTMQGTQRIGWDPANGRFRAWTFDSNGGFSEGTWHQRGASWHLHSTGVTAEGQVTSATGVFTPVNGHTMTWQAINVVVGDERIADTELAHIVRKAPQPK